MRYYAELRGIMLEIYAELCEILNLVVGLQCPKAYTACCRAVVSRRQRLQGSALAAARRSGNEILSIASTALLPSLFRQDFLSVCDLR